MGIIAEFELEPESFVLEEALVLPSVDRVEFERIVPTQLSTMALFWVWGTKFDEFERLARSDPALETLESLMTESDSRLYHATWTDRVTDLCDGLQASDAVLLGACGRETGWEFEIRFPSDDRLSTFSSQCLDCGLHFVLRHLYSLSALDSSLGYGLTPRQRELLVSAVETGYFEEPRDVSLQELADEFGISAPSASGLLRRGTQHLVRSTLVSDD
ncbi:hypothetical protein G6M89_05970 [Natronolimnobius sp. AArcel1]|uniref:helix-turn-helix domain-containing protein n=1 Tax=Natronolimnobius sp. AArcel1 TaxID=1679093 RepID=UPI0013EBC83E|nr:helix-turn-helix domain-containing protein [Natronolimnobius sp. AArcel1]NGM68562.1 hypothetical protein [Natronolimnobius sp. AArcel1]